MYFFLLPSFLSSFLCPLGSHTFTSSSSPPSSSYFPYSFLSFRFHEHKHDRFDLHTYIRCLASPLLMERHLPSLCQRNGLVKNGQLKSRGSWCHSSRSLSQIVAPSRSCLMVKSFCMELLQSVLTRNMLPKTKPHTSTRQT